MNISIKIILDRLMDHPLLQDLTLERVVDYSIDFMRIVGVPNMFIDKTEILSVSNYKTYLPCDLHEIVQIRTFNKDSNHNQPFRYSTNSFHDSICKYDGDFTYKVKGNILHTSMKEGLIECAYKAILTDEDGYPLIPDNSSFTRAIELWIKMKRFTILRDLGKLNNNILEDVKQEYAWAVGDCQSEFNRMTLDKAESFYNSWKTLIIRDNEHNKGFVNNGAKERLKVQ